jgi:hypothetical protein
VAPRRVRFVAPAVAVALALAVTGCSGGDDDDSDAGKPDDTETSSSAMTKAAVELEVKGADLVSPHKARGFLEADTRDAVTGVVRDLLLITSATPLVEGKAGGGFADLFTPDAGARAANHDRPVFFDEGVPSFGELDPKTATVSLTGLAGSMDPKTALVVATYTWDVGSTEHPGDRIVRTGELSLIPVDGQWKIGAYTIAVTRTVDDETTTTTATSQPEGTAP